VEKSAIEALEMLCSDDLESTLPNLCSFLVNYAKVSYAEIEVGGLKAEQGSRVAR